MVFNFHSQIDIIKLKGLVMDLLDYARLNQSVTFEEKKVNAIDLAIWNEINYLVFKGIIPLWQG